MEIKKDIPDMRIPELYSVLSVSGVDTNLKSPRNIPAPLVAIEQSLNSSFVENKPDNKLPLEPVQYTEIYPSSDQITRFYVKKKYSQWSLSWKKYKPVKYTAESVLTSSKADIDQLA